MARALSLQRLASIIVASIAIVIALAGCLAEREPPPELDYRLLTKLTVPVGQELAPTGIRYDRMEDRGAYLIIAGQQALKKRGDSLNWSGIPRDGVTLTLKQRVLWYTEDTLHLVGTARIIVDDPMPTMAPIATTSPIKFSGPVAYGVRSGGTIPGTSLTYLGKTEDGAELGGLSEYPYRNVGDSIVWEGRLRDGVNSRVELRLGQFDRGAMRVAGIVTLWIDP